MYQKCCGLRSFSHSYSGLFLLNTYKPKYYICLFQQRYIQENDNLSFLEEIFMMSRYKIEPQYALIWTWIFSVIFFACHWPFTKTKGGVSSNIVKIFSIFVNFAFWKWFLFFYSVVKLTHNTPMRPSVIIFVAETCSIKSFLKMDNQNYFLMINVMNWMIIFELSYKFFIPYHLKHNFE